MKILHVYNQHRSGGGATAATQATIAVTRETASDVAVLTYKSSDLPSGVLGHLAAGWSAFTGGPARRDFVESLESFRPDLVHVYELFPRPSPWVLEECTRRRIPVVMTCYDYHLTCPARNHFRDGRVCTDCLGGKELRAVTNRCRGSLAESVTMAAYCAAVRMRDVYRRNVSRFIVPADFTGQWLSEHAGIDPERITTIAPIVELPAAGVDPADGTYIAFGGRFVPEKGIDTVLEAARITGLPIRLSRNEQHFVTTKIPRDVTVVINRTREELYEFYRGARMVVVPSIWFETFGLVGAEAMSLGIPIVVSRIGAVGGLIDDGREGLLFEAGNAHDLAAKITELWNDPALCRRLGAAGRVKVATDWNARRHLELHMNVYGEALAAVGRSLDRPQVSEAQREAV